MDSVVQALAPFLSTTYSPRWPFHFTKGFSFRLTTYLSFHGRTSQPRLSHDISPSQIYLSFDASQRLFLTHSLTSRSHVGLTAVWSGLSRFLERVDVVGGGGLTACIYIDTFLSSIAEHQLAWLRLGVVGTVSVRFGSVLLC